MKTKSISWSLGLVAGFIGNVLSGGVARAASDDPRLPDMPWKVAENEEWKRINHTAAEIVESSALDMSRYVEAPAGKYDRVIINPKGKLAFEMAPEKRALFFCAAMGGNFGNTKEEIAHYVQLIMSIPTRRTWLGAFLNPIPANCSWTPTRTTCG